MAESAIIHPGEAAAPRLPAALPSRPRLLALRLRVRLRRHRLDGLVARATVRPGDRALALREAQLAGPRERERVAAGLERSLRAPPPRMPSAAVPIDRAAAEVARPILEELIAALRAPAAVDARGVALARSLVTDACSPLFLPPHPEEADQEGLSRAARRALDALAPFGAGAPDEPARQRM
jgi:hypothetical protein